MSERAARRLLSKLNQEDQTLYQEAIDRIAASFGLRFLLWRFFEECGMAQSPFSSDPLTTARNCGKLEAAYSLRDLIDSIDSNLFLVLQTEMTKHDRDRTDKFDQLSDD